MRGAAGRRRRGRELALRVLFELEGTDRDALEALEYQASDLDAPDDVVAFARRLVLGTLGESTAIDAAIADASVNWDLADLGKVERAILRLATHEIMAGEVPVAVAIDEAVELAHVYAGEEAARFVNGVLGRIARTLRPDDVAAEESAGR